MAHSTFSRKPLGMAVAIAVGIVVAPAVTTAGPLAAVIPVAQAAESAVTLNDNVVRSISVKSFNLYKGEGGSVGLTIPNGGRDDRTKVDDPKDDTRSQYKIIVNMHVPASRDKQEYQLTLNNLEFERGDGRGYDPFYSYDSEDNIARFEFAPTTQAKTYAFTLYAHNSYTGGQDVKAAILGNNTVHHSWTMNVPRPGETPTTPAKPAPTTTTAQPAPTTTQKPSTTTAQPKPTTTKPAPTTTANNPSLTPTGDITAINVDDNGNYTITVTSGKTYEMKIGALRDSVDNLNELVKAQRVDIAKLEKKDQEVLKQAESKIAATEKKLTDLKKDVDAGNTNAETQRRAIAGISTSIVNINNELNTVHTAIKQLTDSDIKEIRDNGNGVFTLIRNNGQEVHGNITVDTTDAVEKIAVNDAGDLVITRGDGKKETVELNRTTVTESKEGDKDLVTITTAAGDVTFEVGNTYISDVVKTDNGNFDIYRNDVEGVWKTIDLTDLRQQITQSQDRVEALKKQHDKDTEEQKKQREQDVKTLNTRIDATNTKLTAAEGAITALKGRATKVEKRVTDIEGSIDTINKDIVTINKAIDVLDKRVDALERHDEDWAKCYSGIGQAAIPLAFAIPLGFLAGLDLPGFDAANANLQQQIGAFNPQAATWLDQNRDGVRAVAGVLGVASVIGIIAHIATTCQDYNASDAAKDTDLAQTSSKITERFSRDENTSAAK